MSWKTTKTTDDSKFEIITDYRICIIASFASLLHAYQSEIIDNDWKLFKLRYETMIVVRPDDNKLKKCAELITEIDVDRKDV